MISVNIHDSDTPANSRPFDDNAAMRGAAIALTERVVFGKANAVVVLHKNDTSVATAFHGHPHQPIVERCSRWSKLQNSPIAQRYHLIVLDKNGGGIHARGDRAIAFDKNLALGVTVRGSQ